jgi:hypothetical protein
VAIAVNSRVYHLADRHLPAPRKGKVTRLYTAAGTQRAVVLYDDGHTLRSPVANLVETT